MAVKEKVCSIYRDIKVAFIRFVDSGVYQRGIFPVDRSL